MNRHISKKPRSFRPRRLLAAATMVGLSAGFGWADDMPLFLNSPIQASIDDDNVAVEQDLDILDVPVATVPTPTADDETTAQFLPDEPDVALQADAPAATASPMAAELGELSVDTTAVVPHSPQAEVWYRGRRAAMPAQNAQGYRPAEIWYGVPTASNATPTGVRRLPSAVDSTIEESEQLVDQEKGSSSDEKPPIRLSSPPDVTWPKQASVAPSRAFVSTFDSASAIHTQPAAAGADRKATQHALATAKPSSAHHHAATLAATSTPTAHARPRDIPPGQAKIDSDEVIASGQHRDADTKSGVAAVPTIIDRVTTNFDPNSPLIFFMVALAFTGPVMLLTCLVALARIGNGGGGGTTWRSRGNSERSGMSQSLPQWPVPYQGLPMMYPGWMPQPMQGWGMPGFTVASPQAGPSPEQPAAPAQPQATPQRPAATATSSRPAEPAKGEQAMIRGIFEDNLKIRTRMRGSSGAGN